MNIYILFILAVSIAMYFVYNKQRMYNSVKEGNPTPTTESQDGRCGPDHQHTYCQSGKYCSDDGTCGITNKHRNDTMNSGYDAADLRNARGGININTTQDNSQPLQDADEVVNFITILESIKNADETTADDIR